MIRQDHSSETPSEQIVSASLERISTGTAEYTMLEFVIQIVRHKRLIAWITGASLMIGVILCFALPVRYTATTRIMPPKQTQSMAALMINQIGMNALSQAAGGAGLLGDPNSVYVGLLKSRPVGDEIIRQFGLMNVYRAKDMTEARNKLKEYTNIVSESSTLISIAVTDRDKKRAADMANAYTERLRDLSRTVSASEATRRREYFEEQLKNQEEALIQAEAAFQQVQQSKGLIRLDTQAGALISNVALLRAQMAAKEVQLQSLRSFSTENNAEVQLAESELAGLRNQVLRLENHNQGSGNSDISLKDVPKAGLEYVRAQREMQYQQAFMDILLRQYEAAKLDESREAAVIQVVEPAVEPDRKSSPHRIAILAISLFAGLFIGCLAAFFLHRLEMESLDPEGSVALARLKLELKR